MLVYGLTGGIATGKSTVARMLAEQGIPILDADLCARAAVAPGSVGLKRIVETFGTEILLPDGNLDREAMGQRVFSDPDARARLNAIVHPLVQELTAAEVARYQAQHAPLLVLDIPLLYEARDPEAFEAVIVVYVDEATQLERLMARNGFSEAQARARMQSQLSIEEKRARGDYVIDNRGDVESTRAQVALLVARLKHEAGVRGPE